MAVLSAVAKLTVIADEAVGETWTVKVRGVVPSEPVASRIVRAGLPSLLMIVPSPWPSTMVALARRP